LELRELNLVQYKELFLPAVLFPAVLFPVVLFLPVGLFLPVSYCPVQGALFD
jgi:hypothetical protein